ncbi:MAG: hypothetical protein ABMA64_23300 [Myxococcota bacterium]
MVLGWIGSALAQDRLVWDFDSAIPEVDEDQGDLAVITPYDPWSGDALQLSLVPAWEFPDVEGWFAFADPVTVTHDTLTLQVYGDGLWWQSVMAVVYLDPDLPYGSASSLGSWEPLVVSGLSQACGQEASIELFVMGWGSVTDFGRTWFDDVAFAGAVCAEYLDTDADGACPLGVDVDGDGDCVEDGERTVDPVDCDDAKFGPTCLTLSVASGAGVATFTAGGAAPGDTVHLVGGVTLGSTCPARLGGSCVDLARPRWLGTTVADAAGLATFEVPVGPSAPASGFAQVVVERPGAPADLSPVTAVVP